MIAFARTAFALMTPFFFWGCLCSENDKSTIAVNATIKQKLLAMRLAPPPPPQPWQRQAAILGKQFFFDPRFSQNGEISCATCHKPELSFTDGKVVSKGMGETNRNAPTLVNVYTGAWFFWDGRKDSLASQALGPIESAVEHGIERQEVVQIIAKHYRSQYESLFGRFPKPGSQPSPAHPQPRKIRQQVSDSNWRKVLTTLDDPKLINELLQRIQTSGKTDLEIIKQKWQEQNSSPPFAPKSLKSPMFYAKKDIDQVFWNFAQAIAEYEKTIVANQSPFDNLLTQVAKSPIGDVPLPKGFSQKAWRGLQLFLGKANCHLCHNGPNLSDNEFHNVGLPRLSPNKDPLPLGRLAGAVTVANDPFRCQARELKLMSRRASAPEQESCDIIEFIDSNNNEIIGAFKTPTLRNVAVTSPYFHNGSAASLEQVINHYTEDTLRAHLGHREEILMGIRLTADEKAELLAFLHSLTSPVREFASF